MVAFDPSKVAYEDLLKTFFEEHDPTQGMRQGNDVGTQYRSGIFFANDAQKETAERCRDAYDEDLRASGKEPMTTEIEPAGPLLLRRGLPPAVPAQGAERLLRPQRHRRHLQHPDRRVGGSGGTAVRAAGRGE